jgi:hypothetical protein
MDRQIQITVTDTEKLTERVIDFFKQFDFVLLENIDGILRFKQNTSLLDAWKTNPLKWGSEISVSIIDNKVLANFQVDDDAQMKTKEEKAVWQAFVDSFENYLTIGKYPKEIIMTTIANNRKSRLTYFSWTILGALIGGLLSFLYTKLAGHNSTFSMFLIPVFATLFLSWRINFVKTKNAL